MINAGQFVNGLWMGAILILFGLAPDILRIAADAKLSFPAALPIRFCTLPRLEVPDEIRTPRWLALLGVAVILLTTLAYIAR